MFYIRRARLLRVVLDMLGSEKDEVEPQVAAAEILFLGFISMTMIPFHLFHS
jgi:hypothetical protein